ANTVYVAANANTVYKSIDGGAHWTTISTGLASSTVTSLVASFDGSLYMDTSSVNIYKSTNQGVTWTPITSGFTAGSAGTQNGLTISLGTPNVLYRIYGGLIYKTTDAGGSWSYGSLQNQLPTASAVAVSVSPSNPLLVYAGS